ncbi:MAG: hypothetical protein H9535_15650 [Ignavibacteria bacterium]|nr:hypothetical protein [Ignavibacteria bacterium]
MSYFLAEPLTDKQSYKSMTATLTMDISTRTRIVQDVADYICRLLEEKLSPMYAFHNVQHTKDVVMESQRIGQACQLSDEEMGILLTAAWFHDAGYTETYDGHEAVSVQLAEEYLSALGCEPDFVEHVISAILSTQMPQQPRSAVEEILCDADVANVGSDTFFEMSARLRKELAAVKGAIFTDTEWYSVQHSFCKFHRFHSEYARRVLGAKQTENLARLERERNRQSTT